MNDYVMMSTIMLLADTLIMYNQGFIKATWLLWFIHYQHNYSFQVNDHLWIFYIPSIHQLAWAAVARTVYYIVINIYVLLFIYVQSYAFEMLTRLVSVEIYF